MKKHFGTSDPELLVAFAELAGKSTACQRPGEERIKMFYSMVSGQNPST